MNNKDFEIQHYQDGIRYFVFPDKRSYLIFNPYEMEKSINLMKEKDISKIILSNEYGEIIDLEFLRDNDLIKLVKAIGISFNNIVDVSPLYDLVNLKSLSISENGKATIDFIKLSYLECIHFEWSNQYKNFQCLKNLKKLEVRKFPKDDLTFFGNCTDLQKLTLNSCRITSFKGAEGFDKLEDLGIYYCRKVNSLNGISTEKLKRIGIYSAPKLYDFSNLKNATNVEIIMLSKLKTIDSLAFLDSMVNLNLVQVKKNKFKVDDGDFGPLERALNRTT